MFRLLLLFCLLCWAGTAFAQAPTWEKLYQRFPDNLNQHFMTAHLAAPNQMLFCGAAPDHPTDRNFRTSYYLLNLATGDTIWYRIGEKVWAGDTEAVWQADGRLITAADEYNPAAPTDYFIGFQTISLSGRKGPRRRYQGLGSGNAFPRGLLPAPNGDVFLAVGINSLNPSGPSDREKVHIARVDSLGQPRWRRYYGLPFGHIAEDIQFDAAGNVVLEIADYDYRRTPFSQMRLLRLDAATGDSLQEARFAAPAGNGSIQFDPYCEMLPLRDGGLLLPGIADTTFRAPIRDGIPFLRKVNAQLQSEWTYVYRGMPLRYLTFVGSCELADGSLLVLATHRFPREATYWLHHVSATGRPLGVYPFTSAICPGFILSGLVGVPGTRTVVVYGAGIGVTAKGGYAARLDLDPSLPLVLSSRPAQPTAAPLTFELFPNPASTTATLRYRLPAGTTAAALHLTDATGRLVLRLALRGGSGGGGEVTVPLAGRAPGLYAATLLAADGRPLATRRLAVAAP